MIFTVPDSPPNEDPVLSVSGRDVRNTETGVITIKKKLSVAYCFEANPIWLLSLDPKNTANIYLVEMDSFSHLMKNLTAN